MKLIDHVYAYNILTNFEYEGNEMTENYNLLHKIFLENFVKSLLVNLFMSDLNRSLLHLGVGAGSFDKKVKIISKL